MDETIHYADTSGEKAKEVIQQIEEKLAPLAVTTKKLGVALVGLGNYSTGQLGPALQETKYCYLAGLVSGSDEKITQWKIKYGIPDTHIYNYENMEKISENPDIDILYIALPNGMHAEFSIRGMNAGKHIICEKPMAISVEECDQMIHASRDTGKFLSIGYRLHFDPYNAEAMKAGQGKVYGDIKYVHATHGLEDARGWRMDRRLSGGGSLMDVGIYCIQAACYTTGMEPISVQVKDGPVDDMTQLLRWEMEFPNGAIALCESIYGERMNLLHADAEHGWLELSPAYSYRGLTGKTATGIMSFGEVNQQALQMDDFAVSILEGKPVTLPGEMGRKDLEIIEAIYESARSGKRVTLEAGDFLH